MGAATSIIFVATKKFGHDKPICHNKHMSVMTQNTSFVKTKLCLLQHNIFAVTKLLHMFVTTKVLSWQAYFRRNENMFATTKVSLSQQNFCHNKILFVATNICDDKTCHDKNMFVA